MKKMKKIASLFLALVMILSLSATAFAADNDGSITISNATVGKTYTAYKIFDANPSGNDDGVIAYTATETQKTWFETQANNPFVFTKNVKETYNVSLAEGKSNEDVIAFLQTYYVEDGEGNITLNTEFAAQVSQEGSATAATATVKFENIPYGYYLVTSTLGATITVDSTNKDVTIIDKNQKGPSWPTDPGDPDKTVGKTITNGDVTADGKTSTASYGDTIDYQIKVDTTNYNGEKKILEYYIKDKLDAGLSYVMAGDNLDVTVKVGDTEITEYTVVMGADGQSFKITIPWYVADAFKYASPNTITVTYSATVDSEDAMIAGDGNKNTATFDYKMDGDPETPPSGDPYHESTEETTTTYVYALGFHKIDAKTKESLEGAEFSIKDSDGNIIGAVQNPDGTYSYTSDTTAADYTTTFVSGANGQIVVKGLKADTYTATETKAPAGYNLLKETVSVTTSVNETSSYTSTTTIYYDNAGNKVDTEQADGTTVTTTYPVNVKEIIVENNSGTELPSTGGMGTTLFYVIGLILVIGAGVLLIVKKRMRIEK